MPSANYVKGRKKEYKVVNEAKAQGCIALRSAGSHSPIDVIVVDIDNKHIRLIQCKPNTMPLSQKRALELKHLALNGFFEVTFEVI